MMDQIVAFEVSPAGEDLPIVAHSPRLSRATCGILRDVAVVDEQGAVETIQIPEERALTVVLDGRALVTLMTLGGAPELMVLGFLINQRVIESAGALVSIDVDWTAAEARVARRTAGRTASRTASRSPAAGPAPDGNRAATGTGQGTVYSDIKHQLSTIRLPPVARSRISRDTVLAILKTMRQHDAIHRKAGSVHSCALFRGTELLACVEDVGRHNGVDTLTGWMAMRGCPGGDKVLFSTGRLTSEMVLKTAISGIPIAISRNGISSMGYDIAAQLGMSLFGRAAKQRFLCYVGAERLE